MFVLHAARMIFDNRGPLLNEFTDHSDDNTLDEDKLAENLSVIL